SYEEYASEQSRFLSREAPADFTDPANPMHYYWFRSNNQLPTDRALSFGYVFLGVRLQCAQCHKHPFDQWSQQDFEKFTQFFTRIKTGAAPDARDAQQQLKTKLGVPVKLDTAALRRQMYLRVSAEGLPIPWNEVWIESAGDEPQVAKLLGDREIDLNEYDDPREPLMAWLLRDENPYFAPAFVNRVWAHYFGVGIVDPPDDFNMANPPSNKALLEWLSREFVEHGYDLKWLHRTITSSRTYQLSWRPNETNRHDDRNFSHARIRRLPAEVTIDAILQATSNEDRLRTWGTNTQGRKITQHPRSIQARGIDYSLLVFGKPLRTTTCDCERQQSPTLLQSLYVRNDHEINEWLQRKDGWLMSIARRLNERLTSETSNAVLYQPVAEETVEPELEVDPLIREAFLRTLSRSPTETELDRGRDHLADSENMVEGLRDLMWALINTQESLLQAGVLSATGLTLPRYLRLLNAAERQESRADSVLFLNLAGGPAHLDTLDMKENLPQETRSQFEPIQSRIAGLSVCEHLPRLATMIDQFTLIRGISHTTGDHPQGQAYISSGNRPGPALKYPSYGSIVMNELATDPELPPYVAIPQTEWSAGFMGDAFAPFKTNAVPKPGETFSVRGISPASGVSVDKIARRDKLLNDLNTRFREAETNSQLLEALDTFGEQAHRMITSETTQKSFDVSREPESVQQLFGKDDVSQSLLLAVRLIEAGSGLGHAPRQLRGTQKAVTSARPRTHGGPYCFEGKGLLERTLVVVMGEFGRTPKINQNVGRDHYPRANWCLMAGGGVKPGQLIGATDAKGEGPDDNTDIHPDDLGASILNALGIDHHKEYYTRTDRPVSLIPHGRPIDGLFS
ncbi:DUF1553 domain-containing protein, partial [Durusdinium trenchii]